MSSLFVTRVSVSHQNKQNDVLVIFNARGDLDDLALSHEIQEDLEEHLEPTDILVLVHDAVFEASKKALTGSSYLEQALERFRPDVRMSLVSFGGLGEETDRVKLLHDRTSSDIPIEKIIRPSITAIFRRRKGFVEASPNYHFENPSGKHTRRFIRLSNLISRHAEISFIGFALLPAVRPDCHTIYTDTPSAFPVIATMNEHRRAAGLDFVAAENFSSYAVLGLKEEINPSDSVVLISASSSGSLASAMCGKLGYPKDQIWHALFSGTAAAEHQVICNLDFDEAENSDGVRQAAPDYRAEACLYCESGSFPIPLYGDQFELPGPQLDALQLTINDEPTGLRKVIGKYAGKGVFGVGMGARQSGFARQYNINVDALRELTEFTSDFTYILKRSIPAASNTIIHLDKPSVPLADLAKSILEQNGHSSVVMVGRDNLDEISISPMDPVVVIAAAVESGRSLLDLSRDLRTICADSPITYIVGVSKSNGSPRREELAVNLAITNHPARHEVVICDALLLPASSEGHAWHRERRLLSRLIERGCSEGGLEDFLQKRVQTLRDENSILVDDLFWTNDLGSKLKVQKGFVFAGSTKVASYSQADVYFTISSVLQKLRASSHSASRAIRSNWFQQTLLSPANFGRFNDGAIQASLLRAALPRELNYSGHEEHSREAGRIIGRIVKNAREARGEAAAEFLLALATKSLILRTADFAQVLSQVPSGLPLLDLLRQLCEDQAGE